MFSLLLCGGALTFVSLVPDIEALLGPLSWDKLNHFIAYAIFNGLLVSTLSTKQHEMTRRLLVYSWAISFSLGLLLEALQPIISAGRHWEMADLLANALGALVSCLFLSAVCIQNKSIDVKKYL